jgi:hypothetical protein
MLVSTVHRDTFICKAQALYYNGRNSAGESQPQYDTSFGDHNGYVDARQTRGGVRSVRSGTMYVSASADGDIGRPSSESAAVECNRLGK